MPTTTAALPPLIPRAKLFGNPTRAQGQIATQHVGFPVYYPRKLVRGSSFAEDAPRTYTITGLDDRRHRAYKMVVFTGAKLIDATVVRRLRMRSW